MVSNYTCTLLAVIIRWRWCSTRSTGSKWEGLHSRWTWTEAKPTTASTVASGSTAEHRRLCSRRGGCAPGDTKRKKRSSSRRSCTAASVYCVRIGVTERKGAGHCRLWWIYKETETVFKAPNPWGQGHAIPPHMYNMIRVHCQNLVTVNVKCLHD